MPQFSLNKEFNELVKAALTEEQMIGDNNNNQTDNKITVEEESAKSPDFFQDKNVIKRKKVGKQYTTTRIKSKNFLSNISYVGISKEDYLFFDNKELKPFFFGEKAK